MPPLPEFDKFFTLKNQVVLSAAESRANLAFILEDIRLVEASFRQRLNSSADEQQTAEINAPLPGFPDLSSSTSPYAAFAGKLGSPDRLLTVLCLAVRIVPERVWAWIDPVRNGIA